MPEGIPYASSNVIASVGTDISYVKDRCFAYSGNLTLASASVVTALDFTTGNDVIEGIFQVSVDADALSTDYLRIFIELNGNSVVYNLEQRGAGSPSGDWINVIIPPYTKVVLKLQGANNATGTGWFVGKLL